MAVTGPQALSNGDERELDDVSEKNLGDEEKGRTPPENDQDFSGLPAEAAAEAEAMPTGPPPGPPGGPAPNGGTTAWLQVAGAWILFFNTWGVLNTFGVYQTYYESGQLFQSSSSDISWIGALQSFLVLTVGLLSGPIFDRGHLRLLLVSGSVTVVFGHMMLSLCTTYWQTMLAQALVIGIGGGLLFVPSLAIMPPYFSTRLGLAIGIAASGSSTGGVIYPIMFYKLLSEVGFPWAVRILGFTMLAMLIFPIVVMKQRFKPGRVRLLFDFTVLTDRPFIFFVFAVVLGFVGLYAGIFYLSFFGSATGYTDASLSFYLVPILNTGSVLGRTLPNWLSDKIGPMNVMAPGAILVGVVLLCNLAVHNAGGMICAALFFGFCSGIFIALPPVLVVVLTADKSKVGTRLGLTMAIAALGALAGGPGGGGILQRRPDHLDWTGIWTYAGVTVLGAGVCFCILRVWKGGFKLMVKV